MKTVRIATLHTHNIHQIDLFRNNNGTLEYFCEKDFQEPMNESTGWADVEFLCEEIAVLVNRELGTSFEHDGGIDNDKMTFKLLPEPKA